MIGFIKRKLKKRKLKNTFKEYGFEINQFDVPGIGKVDYAQWLHPFERPKEINKNQVDFYRQFAKEGDVIIDVGAHTGDTTVPMALAVGKQGKVFGLEPNKYVYKILDQNAKLNTAITNIVPLEFAATEEDGEMEFHYSDASFCNGGFLSQIENQKHGHNYTLKIKGKNLEHYMRMHYPADLSRLALIKVDAEGYDKEILKTLAPMIREFKPYIITECYKRLTEEERKDLFDTIVQWGYSLYYLEEIQEDEGRLKIGRDDLMQWKHFDILGVPDQE